MTMLDDDRLASPSPDAGDGLRHPRHRRRRHLGPGGRGADARRAEGRTGRRRDTIGERGDGTGASRGSAVRRLGAVAARRHRVLSVAACVVVALVLAGTVVTLRLASRPPGHAPRRSPRATAHGPPRPSTPTPAARRDRAAPQQRTAAAAEARRALRAVRRRPHDAGTTTTRRRRCRTARWASPPRFEQTGSLGLTVGRGDLGQTVTQLTDLAGRVRRLRGQLADAVGRAGGGPLRAA